MTLLVFLLLVLLFSMIDLGYFTLGVIVTVISLHMVCSDSRYLEMDWE